MWLLSKWSGYKFNANVTHFRVVYTVLSNWLDLWDVLVCFHLELFVGVWGYCRVRGFFLFVCLGEGGELVCFCCVSAPFVVVFLHTKAQLLMRVFRAERERISLLLMIWERAASRLVWHGGINKNILHLLSTLLVAGFPPPSRRFLFLGDAGAFPRRWPLEDAPGPALESSVPGPGILHSASHILHPASHILHPASSILHPASSILYPACRILHPPSRISASRIRILHPASQHLTSRILHPASCILRFPSSIPHPSSLMLHPPPCILHPTSPILHPASSSSSQRCCTPLSATHSR